jgi:uncharacterized membrane protein
MKVSKGKFFLKEWEKKMVTSVVSETEAETSGEIRVKIIDRLDKGVKTTREQAIHEFYREGMDKTRDKTGVLILVIPPKRQVEILADAGINEKVPAGTWDNVVLEMVGYIKLGENCQAVCQAVNMVGEVLSKNFPKKKDDTNELPNEVIQ